MITASKTYPQATSHFESSYLDSRNFKDSCRNDSAKAVSANIRVMSVFEHQRLIVSDFNQASDFNWLLTQEFAVFSLKRQSGQWQLKVGHYIGIIVLPSGITLEILPKPIHDSNHTDSRQDPRDIIVTRMWVQQMLSDLFHKDSDRRPHYKTLDQLSNDVDVLAALPMQTLPLSEWLDQQFMQLITLYKPTQDYRTTIQNNACLQGKLLLKEQIRHNRAQPHKLVSEVSYLSQETLSNRFIKSALVLLEPLLAQLVSMQHPNLLTSLSAKSLVAWRMVSALNTHELRQLDTLYKSAKRQLNTQPLKPSQVHIAQQLLDWAYWLLCRQQASLQTGSSLSLNNTARDKLASLRQPRLCILFNMNQAFEQWASLRIAMMFTQRNNGYQTHYQLQHSWLRDQWGQNCLSIRPDLLITQNTSNADDKNNKNTGIYSHVIDIKWKALAQASAISASDAYQLTSYAQAYQAEQVWLVYPVTDSQRQPVVLQQHSSTDCSQRIHQAQLWLMPFNVLTSRLND